MDNDSKPSASSSPSPPFPTMGAFQPNTGGVPPEAETAQVPSQLDATAPMDSDNAVTRLEFEMLKAVVFQLVQGTPVGVQVNVSELCRGLGAPELKDGDAD